MLVYGDQQERCDPALSVRRINRDLELAGRMPAGLARHSKLVAVLIESGRLLQGIADAEFAALQRDRLSPTVRELGDFLVSVGRCVCRSWDSGFRDIGEFPELRLNPAWPREVTVKLPEGYAFYAVYPEAYIEAARRLTLRAPPCVLGIRSIGTSLAAAVATALDALTAVTVRPFGDPYDRRISLDASLERELLDGDSHFVIVDEGPGQSGSSFGAVAAWLEERGVARDRIALLPSHSGLPGAAASDGRRRWWASVQKQAADFGGRWPELLMRWCTENLGAPDEPLRDISAGEWRRPRYRDGEEWPPSVPAWERRKFLTSIGGEPVLLKFAGLAAIGERKLAMARTLYSEDLVAEPLGLVHGFIAERWCERATHLEREKPVTDIGRYLATRSRLLPATSGSGASLDQLLTMAKRNIGLELGEAAGGGLDSWKPRLDALERRMVRVRTDNKLDRHEWLRKSDGKLIKTDALDHCQAHDLIGCQPIEWDVAGAIVEFDLDQDQARGLIREIEDAGWPVQQELLEFSRIAYLAFRLGRARLGAEMSPAEAPHLNRAGDRYAAELQLLLECRRDATQPRSLVG